MMLRIGFFLIIILVSLDTAMAQNFVPKSFSAKFEYQIPKLKGDPEKILVDIDFEKTSNLVYEIKNPQHAVTFVCNSSKTWVYTPSFVKGMNGEVKIGDSSRYCFSKIFQALNHGLVDNKIYTVKKTDNEYILTFTKAAKSSLDLDKIGLVFNKKENFDDIKLLKIYKAQNKAQIYELKELKKNVEFKKGHFEFSVPNNTNISNF